MEKALKESIGLKPERLRQPQVCRVQFIWIMTVYLGPKRRHGANESLQFPRTVRQQVFNVLSRFLRYERAVLSRRIQHETFFLLLGDRRKMKTEVEYFLM